MDWLNEDVALDPHKPRTAADYVADKLRDVIAAGLLEPGALLRQDDLARRFKLSRMPVRDALRLLEAEGLILIHPTRGATVARLDAREIREIYAIRELLEAEALRLAYPQLDPKSLRAAKDAFEKLEGEPDVSRWGALNRAFHMSLYGPCGNSRLLGLIEAQHVLCDRYVRMLLSGFDYRARSGDEHRQILIACQNGDLADGLTWLSRHLRDGSHALLSALAAAVPLASS